MIIGVVGLARAGKSEVARILVEEYGYTSLGFADQLKKLALAIDPIIDHLIDHGEHDDFVRLSQAIAEIGPEAVKDEYPEARRFYQALGTKARGLLGSDVWIEAWRQALPGDSDPYGAWRADADVVTPDVRFLNEAEAIRDQFGVIIRVVREGSGLTGAAGQHPSELEQSEIVADYEIVNDSTIADLHRAVAAIVGDLSRTAA